MESPLEVLSQIVRALEEQGVAYVVVGSFASSMRGVYRATADIDIVADLKPAHVRPLVEALRETFHLDEQAVQRATARLLQRHSLRRRFQNRHLRPARRQLQPPTARAAAAGKIAPDVPRGIYVATAEDTILAKLSWYRAGGEVSQVQWADVQGVVGAQGEELDFEYLRGWAERLGVRDLLEKILGGADED
jgi:predicted nucleotidyltransferase